VTAEGDFIALVRKYNAAFLEDFGALSNLARSLVDAKTVDDHFRLIQERTMVVWETFTGIVAMVSLDLPISGLTHCRTLYENVMTTLSLLYDKNRMQDYLDHAKVVAFELNEAMGRDPTELDVVRAEYRTLKPKFVDEHNRSLFWHKTSIAKLVGRVDKERANALGEPEGSFKRLHKMFYRQASSLAHGEGFLGIRYGNGKWYYDVKNYELSGLDSIALNCSYSLVVILCESIIRNFNLPFDEDLATVIEINKKHLTGEDNDDAGGQAVQPNKRK
jgi:hypothetical protein